MPRARELLGPLQAQMKRSKGEFVFEKPTDGPDRSIQTAFETARRHAKLSDVTPHVLRDTFASRLVMNGVPLRTVQELGGWKTLAMAFRYLHLNEEHKQQSIELIGRKSGKHFTRVFSTSKESSIYEVSQVIYK